jgi:hypothetical protein
LGVVAAANCLAGCNVSSNPYHYKLTVEIETPEGVRSGSSVIAVQTTGPMKGAETLGGSGPTARGEAVAVDLPQGKTLFVLLRSESDVDWAGSAHMKSTGLKHDDFPDKLQFLNALRNNRIVYPVQRWVESWRGEKIDNYPILVVFDDIKDPRTVRRVDPDNLAESFGAGYKIKAVTVLGTDDSVTTGIEKRLGWLSKYPEPSLDPDHGPKDFSIAATVHHGDFSIRVRQ